jgi:hypothetical protein
MKWRNTSGLLAVSLVLIAFEPVGAQTFQKIVATEVVVPGLGVTFGELDPPVLSGDELAFRAQSFVSQAGTGIFKADLQENFTPIATRQTSVRAAIFPRSTAGRWPSSGAAVRKAASSPAAAAA